MRRQGSVMKLVVGYRRREKELEVVLLQLGTDGHCYIKNRETSRQNFAPGVFQISNQSFKKLVLLSIAPND